MFLVHLRYCLPGKEALKHIWEYEIDAGALEDSWHAHKVDGQL